MPRPTAYASRATPRSAASAIRDPRIATSLDRHLELVAHRGDPRGRTLGSAAGDERPGQPRLDLALDEAAQRARAEHRVEALARDQVQRLGLEHEAELPLGQPRA